MCVCYECACDHHAEGTAGWRDHLCMSAQQHATCLIPSQSLRYAGKLAVLEALLGCILDGERLRCVVVSSSTAALDLVGSLCAARGWATVRIDGATHPAARQEVVDGFNLYSRGQARDIAAGTSHSCAVQRKK